METHLWNGLGLQIVWHNYTKQPHTFKTHVKYEKNKSVDNMFVLVAHIAISWEYNILK